jgi:hypothetical protein
MQDREQQKLATLIRGQRWAALATVDHGKPYASMVAYVPEPEFAGFLLHLSRLAPHTRYLLADPHACLVISEPDSGRGDPQTLARISIQGTVVELPRDTPDYQSAKNRFLARLPDAELWFQFGDFVMFRLVPQEARYIGGFAQARSLSAAELRACDYGTRAG